MLVSCRERQSHAGTRERGAVERTHLGNDNCQSDGWTALTLICVFNLGLFDESNCHCGGALVSASQSPAGHWSYTGSSQVKDAFFIFVSQPGKLLVSDGFAQSVCLNADIQGWLSGARHAHTEQQDL